MIKGPCKAHGCFTNRESYTECVKQSKIKYILVRPIITKERNKNKEMKKQ